MYLGNHHHHCSHQDRLADEPTLSGDHADPLLEELSNLMLRLHNLQGRLPLPLVEPAQVFCSSDVGANNQTNIYLINSKLPSASLK